MLEYFNHGIKQIKKPLNFYLWIFNVILNNLHDSFGPLEATFQRGSKTINHKSNRCANKDWINNPKVWKSHIWRWEQQQLIWQQQGEL